MESIKDIIIRSEIKLVDITQLKPYKNNAKLHTDTQIKKIAESIKKNGFTQPINIDKNNVVVVGHGRLLASQLLGLKFVPAIDLGDLTDAQIDAYRLEDNKLNESPWIPEMLAISIEELGADVMSQIGFDTEDILAKMDVSVPSDFQDQNFENPLTDSKKVVVVIGRFRFSVTHDEYENWLDALGKQQLTDDKSVITWLKKQLKLG